MRVRYTPDVFRFQRAGGVSRYFVELATGLRQLGVDARIVGGLHINEILASSGAASGLDVSRLRPPRARQALTKVIDQGVSTGLVEACRSSTIVHATWYPLWTAGLPRRTRAVITVHDMIPELFPDLVAPSVRRADAKRAWVKRADHILANSDRTRSDLVEIFDVEPSRVTVTPLGVRVVGPAPFSGSKALAARGPFVLYVGDRRSPYKNFGRLLEALADPVLPTDLDLVCMGSPLEPDESDLIAQLGLAGRVSSRSGPDSTLAWLYSHACALAYPSLYEGFGLPPLEAMAHGCPVVAADAGAIPEVVGDAALLVDPLDTAALAKGIASTLDDPVRSCLIERGRARAARFTWAETTTRTLDVYRRVVS